MRKKTLLLGAHISVSGGYHKAIERALSIGCTTLQIFTKSNRQWAAKPISKEEAITFKENFKESGLHSAIAHASYLINLASHNNAVREQSIKALKQELERCALLDIPYLVLHPGSNSQQSRQDSLACIAESINTILQELPPTNKVMILLETMAGQGNVLCSSFEEIAIIIALITQKSRIGVCVDTCHIFAAGYDLRTKQAYHHTWQQFDTIIGLSYLKVIHCNDSKTAYASRVDRHEDIGKGSLTDECFTLLFNDERFYDIPKILETPKIDLTQDLMNMEHIVTLLEDKTKEELLIKVKES
jgi:deoxyribonuclease IV